MYTWGLINKQLQAAVDGLPPEAVLALVAFMSAVCLNPPEAATGGIGDGWRMPTMAFGARSEGMVSFLVVEAERAFLVTQVAWLG